MGFGGKLILTLDLNQNETPSILNAAQKWAGFWTFGIRLLYVRDPSMTPHFFPYFVLFQLGHVGIPKKTNMYCPWAKMAEKCHFSILR